MISHALLLAGLLAGGTAALAQTPAAPPAAPAPSAARPEAPRPEAARPDIARGQDRMDHMGGHMGGMRTPPRLIVLDKDDIRIQLRCGDEALRTCMDLALQAYDRMNAATPGLNPPPR